MDVTLIRQQFINSVSGTIDITDITTMAMIDHIVELIEKSINAPGGIRPQSYQETTSIILDLLAKMNVTLSEIVKEIRLNRDASSPSLSDREKASLVLLVVSRYQSL